MSFDINKIPKTKIGYAVHFKHVKDHIVNLLTICGIDNRAIGQDSIQPVTCRSCKILAEWITAHSTNTFTDTGEEDYGRSRH